MSLDPSATCDSCTAPMSADARFCPQCGHDQQVSTFDLNPLDSPPVDGTIDSSAATATSTVETSRKRAPMLLGLAAAVILAVVAVVALQGNDTSQPEAASGGAEASDQITGDDETADPPDSDDTPSARAVLGDTEVTSVAEGAEFPLFPASDIERHLIIGRRGAQLLLIDSVTGDVQELSLRSGESYDRPLAGYSIGSVLERLLVVDSGIVRSFSLAGGADFDLSGNVTAFDVREGPTVVVSSALPGADSRDLLEVQSFSSYSVFPSESGLLPLNADVHAVGERVFFEAGGKVFEHQFSLDDGAGFVAVANGTILGAGRTSVIVDQCTVDLDCTQHLVHESGEQIEVELDALIRTPLRVSPEIDWIVAPFGGGVRASELSGDRQMDLPTTPLLGVSWTSDGRYLVASGAGSVSITDLDSMATSVIDIDGTGQVFDELLVVPAPESWIPGG